MYKVSSELLEQIKKHLENVHHEKLQSKTAVENTRLIKLLEEDFNIRWLNN